MGEGIRELRTHEELEEVLLVSDTRPQWILKHSTACPISARAFAEFTRYASAVGAMAGGRAGEATSAPGFALVKVIEARPVSDALAVGLGVYHQSPQVLLVHGGRAVWHASHYEITGAAMEAALVRLAR